MVRRRGFTLVELLIYVAIFALIAGMFVTILVSMVDIQAQQSASNEAQQQGQFLEQQIDYYVQNARLVDMVLDTATSMLVLRETIASSSFDPTSISLAGGTVYLIQGTGSPQALTSNRVTVSNLSFTHHFNINSTSSPYGVDSVSYSFTVSAQNGQTAYHQSFQSSASVAAPVPKAALIQQTKTEDNSGTSTLISAQYSSDNETGDLLLAVVANQNLVTSTVSDTGGNAWTEIASTSYATYSGETAIFAAPDAAGGANTVTASFGGAGAYDPSIFIYEYRGVATSSPLDVWAAQAQSDTSTPSSPSVSPTSSVELIFGVNSNMYPTTAAATPGPGYTLESSSTSGYSTQVFAEDMNQYITTAVSAPWTMNTPVSSTAMIATFMSGNLTPTTVSSNTIPAIVQSAKYQPGSAGTSIVFALGTAPIPGDILLAYTSYSQYAATRTISSPSGAWTQVDNLTNGYDSLAVWWHVVAFGDGTSYTFPISGSSEWQSGVIYEISGANTINPINQHSIGTSTNNNGNYGVGGPLTPSTLNTLPIGAVDTDSGSSITAILPSGQWTVDQQAQTSYHSTDSAHQNNLTSNISTAISPTFEMSSPIGITALDLIAPPNP